MKKYKLRFLPLFEKDLNQIVDYICLQLENQTAPYSLVDDVYKAIKKRLPYAESFEPYPSKKKRSLPYYRIYVKNYIIFYVVDGDIMEVRRILYSRRDLGQQL
ncbi:MAG: type II toxin-antitoxin system RelE/ParE family toxin [Candidatus Riflebacteria bacterium]|nr:type II toxin-antitoxin system RelE/ParE family toxin [Candidatus Riflebacteria bacterium]